MKTIKYYRVSQYGQMREFVHPDNQLEGEVIKHLVGKATITSAVRKRLEVLSDGAIQFEETVMPEKVKP